jgi:hypothetical protein
MSGPLTPHPVNVAIKIMKKNILDEVIAHIMSN